MSFKKKDKIKKQNEIVNVINSGEKVKSHYIDYFYKKSKRNRIAIILNKAIKKANKRSKVKRRIREIYRKKEKEEKNDLIIKIKKSVIKIRYEEIKKEINRKIESIERKRKKSE